MIKMLYRLLRKMIAKKIYMLSGRRPWRFGYSVWHRESIIKAISNHDCIQHFADNLPFEAPFGIGLDERIIEYPWIISKLIKYSDNKHILDAGSTFNMEFLLDHPVFKQKKLTIMTLAPESSCFWHRGISYQFGDLRDIPFKSETFDAVYCISVLEHIGMDNTAIYTSDSAKQENKPSAYKEALKELYRVLRKKGRMFITVPFGKYENHTFFQQFDKSMVDELPSVLPDCNFLTTYFRYDTAGWINSAPERCSDLLYHNVHASTNSQRYSADNAAAARGVACIEIQKV